MLIQQACEEFKNTGHFILNDAALNLQTLSNLKDEIKKIKLETSHSDYQLQLKAIRFTSTIKNEPPVMVGAITTKEQAPILRKETQGQADAYLRTLLRNPNTTLTKWMGLGIPDRSRPAQEIKQQDKLENILLEILNLGWQLIHLDQVVFSWQETANSHLSPSFYSKLFKQLMAKGHALRELSVELNPENLTPLSNFVANTVALKTLRLDMHSFTVNFGDLALKLGRCLQLKVLEFKNPPEIYDFYAALNQLLDEHYQLEQVIVAKPQRESIRALHSQLLKRLKNSNMERFKKEQITQTKLLNLLEADLMTDEKNLFNALFDSSPSKAISDTQWIDGISTLLPTVYRNHIDYVRQHTTDFRLDLQQPLQTAPHKTVGGYLLTKAYKANDVTALERLISSDETILQQVCNFERIGCTLLKKAFTEENLTMCRVLLAADKTLLQEPYRFYDSSKTVGYFLLEEAVHKQAKEQLAMLLEAGADLFEKSDETSLVAQLFADKELVLWREVEQHLQKAWPELIPEIVCLAPFSGLYRLLTETKQHLDSYLHALLERKNSPFNGVRHRFGERSLEWGKFLCMFVQLIKGVTQDSEIGVTQFSALDEGIEQIIVDAQQAKRGRLNTKSELHDGIERLGTELKTELQSLKSQVATNTQEVQYLKTQLQETLAELQREKEEHARDNAKAAEREVQLEATLKAEAKEHEAKSKAESEARETKLKAEAQELVAQLKADMQAQSEKQIGELRNALSTLARQVTQLSASLPYTTTTHLESSVAEPEAANTGPSASFFK
jgi:hypothetical protein